MSSRPFESPPPYRPDEFKPSHYAPSNITYAEEMRSQPMYSQPAYSYYPEDEVQHFYKWTSPPGIIKIMSVLIIVMCVGIFACVASTLPWDLEFYGSSSLGSGIGYPGYSSFGGSYSGSYGYGYGYGGAYGIGGNYIEPRAAKGFMLAMSAFCFIAGMAIFIISVTNSSMSRTRRYYLIVIIAIAIVLGFLIIVAFAIIIYFSVKTRSQMNYYGKMNILWDKAKVYEEDPPNVEEWVKTVNAEPAEIPVVDYPDRVASSMVYSVSGQANENRVYTDTYRAMPKSEVIVPLTKDLTQSNYTGNSSYDGSTKEPPQKRRAGRQKRTNSDNYDADYTTGGESCDELEEDWDREYPPITTDQQRQAYKRDFDFRLQEYKSLQAELDEVSKTLSRLDKELDDYSEDSEEYKVAADEYNRMKDIKASADYKNKKAQCKKLKSKLSHIKRMVSDYDNRRS
ncbi:occludin isoform X2 [Gopherus flavomarginatus]|uniref:occludin isoform X2 n=1 Tax=Gopherus flavomarginatus TaxID=286002 RepID=UPI0021CB9E72|nr:occludin isoform X2 [Gopherus flavomarginatus]